MKAFDIDTLKEKYPYLSERESSDCLSLNIPLEKSLSFFKVLKDEYKYNLLVDITAIDWGKETTPRFTVVYHLYTTAWHTYLRLAVECTSNEAPVVPSVVHLWSAANWHEREAYDMFGIQFEGHPDLRRILMWDSYEYYPLRKDFPLAGIESELPSEDVAEATQAKVAAAPMMGGPFKASQAKNMSSREPRGADESWTEQNKKPTIEAD